MLIDCDRCAGRGRACAGCVVNVLLDASTHVGGLRDEECRALEAFERAGLAVEVIQVPSPPTTRWQRTDGYRRTVA